MTRVATTTCCPGAEGPRGSFGRASLHANGLAELVVASRTTFPLTDQRNCTRRHFFALCRFLPPNRSVYPNSCASVDQREHGTPFFSQLSSSRSNKSFANSAGLAKSKITASRRNWLPPPALKCHEINSPTRASSLTMPYNSPSSIAPSISSGHALDLEMTSFQTRLQCSSRMDSRTRRTSATFL